jgi:hypothetical protein
VRVYDHKGECMYVYVSVYICTVFRKNIGKTFEFGDGSATGSNKPRFFQEKKVKVAKALATLFCVAGTLPCYKFHNVLYTIISNDWHNL